MSRFIQGNCVHIMSGFPDNAVDFILTDPPYLVGSGKDHEYASQRRGVMLKVMSRMVRQRIYIC